LKKEEKLVHTPKCVCVYIYYKYVCVYFLAVVDFSSLYSRWNLNFWLKEPPEVLRPHKSLEIIWWPVAGIVEKNNIYFLKQNINIIYILVEKKGWDGENPPQWKMIIYTITLAEIFMERVFIIYIYIYIYIYYESDR